MRRFRAKRRSGISNLVGAVFFVLIVGLVLSTLIIIFTVSSGYIGGIHSSNEVAQQQAGANVTVSSAAFGGELAVGDSNIPVDGTNPVPLLPVSNMNFTDGIQGWYISHSYQDLVDSAQVTNALKSNGSSYIEETVLAPMQSANTELFTLTVMNTAAAGSGHFVDKVSLLVDTYFDAVTCQGYPVCNGWTATVTGNNLTLTIAPVAGIAPGSSVSWTWSADVPEELGSFHDTVVLYWYSDTAPNPLIDYGITTVTTTIASPLPSPLPAAPTDLIRSETAGVSPGGLTAGYDNTGITTDSGSDYGSVFMNYEPTYSGQPLPAGQQLSTSVTFTTTFALSESEICQLRVTGPCGQICNSDCYMDATMAASLDNASSVPNLLVYYHYELVNPSGTVYVINPGGTDPTTVNHFSPTGWQEMNTQFAPSGAFWVPGTYSLEVVVNATMPSGQPSELEMHFDNIGVALNLETPSSGGSAYGSGIVSFTFAPSISYNQAQEVTLGLNMSLASSPTTQTFTNTIAYIYGASTPVAVLEESSPTQWTELEALSFNNTANANAVIQLPASTGFISGDQLQVKVVVVSVGNGGNCEPLGQSPNCTLIVTGYAVATTLNTPQATGQIVLTISNPQGGEPLKLTSLFISGPNGTLPASSAIGNTNGLATFFLDNYVKAGSNIVISEDLAQQNFLWVPGQVYEITIITSSGTSYSNSFTAP